MNKKPHISIAFIGGTDSGKSILINQICKLRPWEFWNYMGNTIEKIDTFLEFTYDREKFCHEYGSLYTVNFSLYHLETDKHHFTLIDTPSRGDLAENIITGIALADYAILVGPSEKKMFNQMTRKNTYYSYLACAMGVEQKIVCVNQIENVPNSSSESDFENIKLELTKTLNKIDSSLESILFIPTSGLKNINIINSSPDLFWYKGPNLFEAILNLNEPQRNTESPLRIIVSQVFNINGFGRNISGRIVSGTLRSGQAVTIAPSGISGFVEYIEIFEEETEIAYAGDIVELCVTNLDSSVRKGSVISDTQNYPAKRCESFSAEICIVDVPGTIIPGYCPDVRIHAAQVSCRFEILLKTFDSETGAILEENPDCLRSNNYALVVMAPLEPLCVETYAEYPKLGSLVICDKRRIIAIGKIREVFKQEIAEI